jgi:hypothetical protein
MMRFDRNPLRERVGEKRVIKKFLFVPKTLENQTRWLEWSYICQTVDCEFGDSKYRWKDRFWVDWWGKEIE